MTLLIAAAVPALRRAAPGDWRGCDAAADELSPAQVTTWVATAASARRIRYISAARALLNTRDVDKPMNLSVPMVRIRLKCPDVDSFADKYHADVNPAGIFVRTRSPLGAGTSISFDFRLADDRCLFRGSGVVVWSRPDETLAPLLDPGMMLSFDELREGTRENFDYVLARRRSMEEAADTVPTLVRRFTGEREPLPPTTKMAADEVEALRARLRDECEPPAPAAAALAPEPPSSPPPLPPPPEPAPKLMPAPRPMPAPLAKILVLRPESVPPPAAMRPNLMQRMLHWIGGA
jgi:uncharacterized protein (TIGR02266 family)